MKKWMYDCVIEAPDACRTVLKNRSQLEDFAELFIKKQYKKLVLVASGSSLNIANCAKYAMQDLLSIHIECIPAVTFATYDYCYHEDAFVLFLSQSGKSTNTMEAIKTALQHHLDIAVITMIKDSPMSRMCENSYTYGTAEFGEDVFVCRGVPSSSLFLMLFAMEAGLKKGVVSKEQYKKDRKELENLVKEMDKVRSLIDIWYDKNMEELHNVKRFMSVGIGPGYGVALEGALKIEETVGIPANAYEADEYLHGPAFEIKKDHGVFIVDLDERFHDRALMIYEASKQLTDKVYMVTKFPSFSDKRVLTLNAPISSNYLPILFVMPFQITASRICDDLRISAITVYNYRAMQIAKTKAD